jgi:hypothetical protein
MSVEIGMSSAELPPEVDLDGVFDEATGVEYIGKALRQPSGKYVCLAKICQSLVRVEVSIASTGRAGV